MLVHALTRFSISRTNGTFVAESGSARQTALSRKSLFKPFTSTLFARMAARFFVRRLNPASHIKDEKKPQAVHQTVERTQRHDQPES